MIAMSSANQPLTATWAEPFLPDGPPPERPLWACESHAWQPALINHYLEAFTAPGDLVLDPFADQPSLVAGAAAGKRRLLLSHFSPAHLLGLKASALPPDRVALDAAFTRIADAPRRGRSLAQHLQALYETICPECAQSCTATYYIWDRVVGEPVQKHYACPHCGNAGLAPADMADGDLAAGLEVRGAAYWGLLSRLVAPGDPLTDKARSLMERYTPRALLAISELISTLNQRIGEPDQLEAARALVLHVLERCISRQERPDPTDHAGPEPARIEPGLPAPGQFIERNVWLAFAEAHQELRSRQASGRRLASDLKGLLGAEGQGATHLLSLALSDLAKSLEPGSVALVLSTSPRLDPDTYALSFLWTGWIFGREAATRLQATLKVEALDWDWYARSMAASFETLRRLLRPDGRLVLAFSDFSARRALALLAAAAQAGFRLVAQAAQAPLTAQDAASSWRLVFRPEPPASRSEPAPALADRLQGTAQDAVRRVIDRRGEPVPASLVHTACAVQWAEAGLLAQAGQGPQTARQPVSFLVQQARLALDPEMPPPGLSFFRDEAEDRPGQWQATRPGEKPPLADRVESLIVRLLSDGQAWPEERLAARIYEQLPGWETPDAALIAACLASYTDGDADGLRRLRAEDMPAQRARERGELLLRLQALGHRLDFEVWIAPNEQSAALGLVPLGRGGPARGEDWAPAGLVWHEDGQPAQAFALSLQALLYPWLAPLPPALENCQRYVVLPGGRASLLAFKLQRCPIWRSWLAETGWEFVKSRHVRRLAAVTDLSLAGFRARIGLDPVVVQANKQLNLFEDTSPPEDSYRQVGVQASDPRPA